MATLSRGGQSLAVEIGDHKCRAAVLDIVDIPKVAAHPGLLKRGPVEPLESETLHTLWHCRLERFLKLLGDIAFALMQAGGLESRA